MPLTERRVGQGRQAKWFGEGLRGEWVLADVNGWGWRPERLQRRTPEQISVGDHRRVARVERRS